MAGPAANPYVYAANDPLNATDPLGTFILVPGSLQPIAAERNDAAHYVSAALHATTREVPNPPGTGRTGLCTTHQATSAFSYVGFEAFLSETDTQQLINDLELPTAFAGTEISASVGIAARLLRNRIAAWLGASVVDVSDIVGDILLIIAALDVIAGNRHGQQLTFAEMSSPRTATARTRAAPGASPSPRRTSSRSRRRSPGSSTCSPPTGSPTPPGAAGRATRPASCSPTSSMPRSSTTPAGTAGART
jgi:hypothetical protein